MNMINNNPDLTRIELLFVLDYLFKYTDEEHPAVQKKIIDHVQEKHNITIRRQRIPEILELLYRLTNEENKMPFKVAKVSTGVKFKYYMAEWPISHEDLLTTIITINENAFLSRLDSNRLIRKILRPNTSISTRRKLLDASVEKKKTSKKYSYRVLRLTKVFEEAIVKQQIITMRIKDGTQFEQSVINTLGPEVWRQHFIRRYQRSVYEGRFYIYALREVNNAVYAITADIDLRILLAIPLNSVLYRMQIDESYGLAPRIQELLLNFNYASLEEYLKQIVLPKTHKIIDIEFVFPSEALSGNLSNILSSYELFFGRRMNYKRGRYDDNNNLILLEDENPDYNRRAHHLFRFTNIYVKEKMDQETFIDWLFSSGSLGIIKILSPNSLKVALKDRLLGWANLITINEETN